jgi:hypothetical protein
MDPTTPEAQEAIVESAPPVIEVNDFDMHEVHIEVHNRFRMSQEYEVLPDETKQQFAKHVASHQMYLQQVLFNQQQMMAGPQGAPGADGAAPGAAPAPGGEELPPEGGDPMTGMGVEAPMTEPSGGMPPGI